MNKDQIDLLNIDKEEKLIINKLNNRLVNLNKNIDEYFNKSEILSYDSVSSAFLSKSDPATLANKYSDIVDNFNNLISKIINAYQEETPQEEPRKLTNDIDIIQQIDKSLDNRGEFFTKKTKQRIINLASDIREEFTNVEPDLTKVNEMTKEFDLLLQQLMVLTNTEGLITVESISNDLKKLENLEIKPIVANTRFSIKQKLLVFGLLATLMSMMGVQIWMILI